MKKIIILFVLCNFSLVQYGQIIADHTVVDRYDEIPQYYIDKVKEMWLVVAGESHSEAYRRGLSSLESINSKYTASVRESGTPEAYTTMHLRASRATWGDYVNSSGWIYGYGEEDWWTNATAVSRTKAGITYCNTNNLTIAAIGFGWCWDHVNYSKSATADPVYGCRWSGTSINGPSGAKPWGLDAADNSITGNTVNMDTYLSVTQEYIDFCKTNGYATKVFFTTAPVDTYFTGEDGYQGHLKHERIRNYVKSGTERILFDYADILCYDDNGVQTTTTWNGHTYPTITTQNLGDGTVGHIGSAGAVRLAKSMWWMLARMAGWDGGTSIPEGTWLGETNDWNDIANWPVEKPTITTDVIISSSTPNQPFIFSSPTAICRNLNINADASLTITPGQAVTVSGNLVNNGNIIIESAGTSSSGSLIVGSASGPGTITYHRNMREGDDYGDKHLLSAPVAGQSIADFISDNDSKIDIVRIWDEVNGVWSQVISGDFISGKGYNVNQADISDGVFSFSGPLISSASVTATSPYAESYETRVAGYPDNPYGNDDPDQIEWATDRGWTEGWGGGGWNLLGNPFTSALDAAVFISDNTISFDPFYQALYVYDGVNGVYLYSAATVPGYPIGTGSHGSVIQAGQGFMVMTNNNGVQFSFNHLMQTHGTDVTYLKSANAEEPWPGLQLKVKYGDKENVTTVIYNNDMTTGLDPGYDIGQLSTGPAVEIYTTQVSEDISINLARQALPISRADTIIVPVGIDSEKGGEITFSAFTVLVGSNKFWLEDRTSATFTDLTTKSYRTIIPANTYGTGRFFIHSSTNSPTGIQPQSEESWIRIWTYDDKVIIKGNVGERAICEIYNYRGQQVLKTNLTDGELNTVDLYSKLKGVYMVRILDGVKVYTQKVVLL